MKEGSAPGSPSAAPDQDDSGTDRQRDKEGDSNSFNQVLHPFNSWQHWGDTSNACYEALVKYSRCRRPYSSSLVPRAQPVGPSNPVLSVT
jgi:hypothetical protein